MFIWRVLRTKVKLTGMVSCINMKSVSGWYQYSQLEIYSNLYSDHTFLKRQKLLEELFNSDPSAR